jgi:tetratricopeptide (TPR) repeat protein
VEDARLQLAKLSVEAPAPAPAPSVPVVVDGAAARFERALGLYRQKQYDEAAAIFLALYSEDNKRTKALYRHALSLRQANRLDKARAAFERYLLVTLAEARASTDPERAVAAAGKEKAAAQRREQAGAAKPTPSAFVKALEEGEEKLQANDPKGAIASFQRALALDPGSARPLWGLARAHEAADDKPGARHHYRLHVQSDALDLEDKLAGEAFWKAETL